METDVGLINCFVLLKPPKGIPKPLNLQKKEVFTEIREGLKPQEIENASSRFKKCPRCNSKEGFWLGIKEGHIHIQCKHCGVEFELVEAYTSCMRRETWKLSFSGSSHTSPWLIE
jgi:hypothetical protein